MGILPSDLSVHRYGRMGVSVYMSEETKLEGVFYSIIVVCLNAGKRLQDTVESIFEQDYNKFEVIVKDGGSSDGSIERLKDSFTDERLHIYIQKDTGIYDAMNQAIKLANGAYFLFLNAGDSFYNNTVLNKITDEIEKKKKENKRVDVIYGNLYHKLLDTFIFAAPTINDFACYRNVPCHQTCFYHRSLFTARGYNTKYNVRADYEHFLWCYYKKKALFYYVPVTIAAYEGGGYSETKENKKRSAHQHQEIVVHYMGKKKVTKYRFIMLLTFAPIRSAIAESKYLSGMYNGLKTAVYKMKGR